MTESVRDELREVLTPFRQQHLLRWWDELSSQQRHLLAAQIRDVDFVQLQRLAAAQHVGGDDSGSQSPIARAHRAISPRNVLRLPDLRDDPSSRERAAQIGRDMLSSAQVAVVLVAGGQGTRLGFPHPKGMFPIGPVSGNSLFQLLAEQVLARSRQAGCVIPYYVMTSDATHDETIASFQEHEHFGLNSAEVFFFRQGNMPALDAETGRVLMADKHLLIAAPDGHGGLLQALSRSGLLDDMRQRQIEYLFCHQVDNPAVNVCDPVFLGYHQLWNSEMSTKVVAKKTPDEPMGVLVDVDGRTQIIEYSDLPKGLETKTEDSGAPVFWAGNMAIHIFNRTFLERLIDDLPPLPFHVARKKVNFLDETGRPIAPDEPNAFKFERFIFDAMPHAETALVFETDRSREFHPVKNATGNDSAETAQQAATLLFTKWLQDAGAEVADGVAVEISPLCALDGNEVREKITPGTRFEEAIYLR